MTNLDLISEAIGYIERIDTESCLKELAINRMKQFVLLNTPQPKGGKVKIYEKAGMRKDRYSSLSYNYYVATQLESKMSKRYSINSQSSDMFVIKPPSYKGKAVNRTNGIRGAKW